ncbi:unnamed protein product [Lampetra planeri]
MARLVAVCRNGEDGFPFKKRQIPLAIDDTLTLVMEFPDTLLNAEGGQVNSAQLKQFTQHYEMLSGQELVCAVRVPPRELVGCLPEQVACVGCRGSVERLFSALLESGTPALEPLLLESSGELVVCHSYLADARKLYCLFYLHGAKLNDILDSIPKSKKNRRCPFHSLDTHKAKPLGGSWTDVWDRMSQDCRDEVVLIDSDCLLETLETHLRKHRFCGECKTKVLRAYAILTGEVDGSKEKGYCAGLYEGLRSCPHERHVHVSCDTTFISHLLGRAVSELAGGYVPWSGWRRERHAKTLDSAQEEVVTCLAIHLYERLHRIWQRLRAEEQTWQLLFHLGVDALRKSFEVAVERKQGVSRIDMLCEELWEEERARELRQEKKRQKRRNRRKNKFGLDGADANTDLAEPVQVRNRRCTSGLVAFVACKRASGLRGWLTLTTALVVNPPLDESSHFLPHRYGFDCGYSSSAEGSEPGSQDGSEGSCRVDGGGGVEKAPAGCCPECTAKSALPLAAETLPDGGKKKKKKKKNQGQQADEPEDVGAPAAPAAVCAQPKLGVCVRCDGCGAVGHRSPDKGIPLVAAAAAIAQQPELKKAQAAQTEIKQQAQKQADAKQGAKKQAEAKQQPLAKQPDAKHKQPDAKQPAQRQPEAKQAGQRPPDGKQAAQKQPDGKQAAPKQQEVKQPPQKQPDGKQPAQKQEIKQPAHKQADVKQASQKQQDAKQPLQKQQDGKQAAVQKSNGVQKANDQRVAQQGTRAQQQKVQQQQQQLKKGGQKRGGKQPTGGEEKQDPARSLADMLDDSDDCFPDAESFISPDEIRSFKASHRAFYVQRDQYRQQLQERFNQYCNAHNGPCDQRCCNGKWLATAGVK